MKRYNYGLQIVLADERSSRFLVLGRKGFMGRETRDREFSMVPAVGWRSPCTLELVGPEGVEATVYVDPANVEALLGLPLETMAARERLVAEAHDGLARNREAAGDAA